MQSFVSRHQHQIQGTLSGFDRLRFVGSLLRLSYLDGLAGFLAVTGVLLKETLSGASSKLDAPYRLTPHPCEGPAQFDPCLEPRRSAVLVSGLATGPPAGVGGRLGPFLAA